MRTMFLSANCRDTVIGYGKSTLFQRCGNLQKTCFSRFYLFVKNFYMHKFGNWFSFQEFSLILLLPVWDKWKHLIIHIGDYLSKLDQKPSLSRISNNLLVFYNIKENVPCFLVTEGKTEKRKSYSTTTRSCKYY